MESDLLLKEDEFYKENQKLELKTKQLMQKVNDVMKIQDHLITDSLKTHSEISDVRKNTYKFAKKPSEDVLFIEEESSGTTGGIIRSYKAKLKGLAAEKERAQIELRHKTEEVKKLQKENQTLKEEKEKWFFSYNNAKNAIGKLENQLTNINARLQSKEAETGNLKKELDSVKKELKTASINLNNCEVRLLRASEEAEKLRAALKLCKEDDKDIREGHRKQINELTAALKQTEKHKTELLNGFKKQTQLIDVLQKQKVQLEAYKIGEMTEGEYLKILDWKFAC